MALAVLAAGVYYAAPRIGPTSQAAAYGEKLAAARTTLDAESAILDANREKAEGSQLSNDPAIAAMLGLPTSPLTTDAGSLRAKITSTNPNFAALVVGFLSDAGVERGDVVAIAYTGSFPALDIAAVAATEALGAEPVIVSSIGASTWGANDPEFTIVDMEALLAGQGIIHHRSVAASVGGDFRVHPLEPQARDLAQKAIERNDVLFLHAQKLQDSIRQRLQIYDQEATGRPIKAFVNVGGGLASIGNRTGEQQFDPGLTVGPEKGDVEAEGLLYYMQQRGVATVNLTDIVSLAQKYRFAVNPLELPPIGEGTPWRNWTSLRVRAGIAAGILLLATVLMRLFVLSPSGQREFDSYFGFAPLRIKAALRKIGLRRRPLTEPRPSEGADFDG